MSPINEAINRARHHAPYLAQSLDLFPEITAQVTQSAPDVVFSDLAAALPETIDILDVEMARLRTFKRQAHLVIALADIAQVWDWAAVTEHLTQLADICMTRLLRAAAVEANIEGTPANPVPGLFVLAVGKYGARELNYSSDIDFNVFYDPEIVALPNPARAERTLIKVVQSLIKGFERITGEGYIFRTDLRLRPDPRSNAVAVSTHTAERYYETLGQNWERAAMIKARVCGGDMSAGQAFIDHVLSPFIWRRNLDYAAIDDILAIKRQIHAGKGGMDINVPGHHLKLGKGGIREIEFYAQVQQLILGGRQPELRAMRTVDALSELAKGGFISLKDARQLTSHYGALRTYEHRAQMVDDEQTHHVPDGITERDNYARLCGFDNRAALEDNVLEVLTDVHARYVALFPDVETLSSREGNLVFTGVDPDPETLATFSRLGFERGAHVWRQMADWLGGRIRATKTERAREYLTALAPQLIDYCADTKHPDQAFDAFAQFFTALNRGVSILSMFSNEPERLGQLVDLMVRSPLIAERLAAKPEILDAMADPEFFNINGDDITSSYVATFVDADDFEEALNAARRRVREDHFRITAAVLTGRLETDQVGELFTSIADAAITGLLPAAIAEVERVAGPMAGDVAVIGMGKVGGREMRFTSDLDIMLVYQPGENEENAQRFYTKVTQRLISALSAVTEEGGLYEVDMALRPSGRAGPVAVTVEAFASYYELKAWTWEFMALTRARIVAASSQAFWGELTGALETAILTRREDLDMPADIADMLQRTKREKPPKNDFDVKNIDGGLRDIEYIAQALYLQNRSAHYAAGHADTAGMIDMAESLGQLSRGHAKTLRKALELYTHIAQMAGMTGAGVSDDLGKSLRKQTQAVSRLTQRYIFKK